MQDILIRISDWASYINVKESTIKKWCRSADIKVSDGFVSFEEILEYTMEYRDGLYLRKKYEYLFDSDKSEEACAAIALTDIINSLKFIVTDNPITKTKYEFSIKLKSLKIKVI